MGGRALGRALTCSIPQAFGRASCPPSTTHNAKGPGKAWGAEHWAEPSPARSPGHSAVSLRGAGHTKGGADGIVWLRSEPMCEISGRNVRKIWAEFDGNLSSKSDFSSSSSSSAYDGISMRAGDGRRRAALRRTQRRQQWAAESSSPRAAASTYV